MLGSAKNGKNRGRKHMAAVIPLLLLLLSPVQAQEVVRYQVQGAFEDVLQDVEDAIIGQGLKITYRADVAGMLARTGKDLGFAPVLKGGQVLQFCSARLSYEAMKADAANIAFCPYGVFVVQGVGQENTVTVGYRKLPARQAASAAARKALEAVNALLERIVKEAVGE